VGEWFAVVSADYARGEAVVRFTSDSGSESVWLVYLVGSTELCGIVASTNGALATCRPKGGEQRMVTAEKGQVLQLDPYSVEIVGNLTMKIGNLMPQTDSSKKLALADEDVNRVAIVLIYPGNRVTISYADASWRFQ
jgi:hypothetical protein